MSNDPDKEILREKAADKAKFFSFVKQNVLADTAENWSVTLIKFGIFVLIGITCYALYQWAALSKSQRVKIEETVGPKLETALDKFISMADHGDKMMANGEDATLKLANIAGTLDDATKDAKDKQLPAFYANLNNTFKRTNDQFLPAATALLTSGKEQLVANGKAIEAVPIQVRAMLAGYDPKIRDAITYFAQSGQNIMLLTGDEHLKKMAERGDNILLKVEEATGKVTVIEDKLIGIGEEAESFTGHLDNMAADTEVFVHKNVNPDPVHGKWAKTKQIFGTILRTAQGVGGVSYVWLKVTKVIP